MSDTPDTPAPETVKLVPAGPPIGSEPRVVTLNHVCEGCGKRDAIPLAIAGQLVLLKAETKVQLVTPADVARMRGPRGIA